MLSAQLSQRLGLEGISLVAVAKIGEVEPDMPLLYKLAGKYYIDPVTYDDESQLFLIEKGGSDFVFLTDLAILGTPIGYCGSQKGIYDMLIFRKIPPVCDR